jgi:hypothetical protein
MTIETRKAHAADTESNDAKVNGKRTLIGARAKLNEAAQPRPRHGGGAHHHHRRDDDGRAGEHRRGTMTKETNMSNDDASLLITYMRACEIVGQDKLDAAHRRRQAAADSIEPTSPERQACSRARRSSGCGRRAASSLG